MSRLVVATITITRFIKGDEFYDELRTESVDGSALDQVETLGMLTKAMLDTYFEDDE